MGLTIIGAVLFITGLLMVVVGEALRLKSGHRGTGIASTGELVAFCGLGIGVALLVVLAVGRPDREPADRTRGGRARIDRARGDGDVRGRRRAAGAGGGPGRQRDTPEEWLGPLRTAGAGVVPRHVPSSWPERVDRRLGARDYADDGWRPGPGEEWSPGPAYIWSPGLEEGWDNGEDGSWDHGGDRDWNLGRDEPWDLGEPAGNTAWPQAHLAGPEPGPVPGYGSERDVEYGVRPAAGHVTAGPGSGPAAAPKFTADLEADYRRAAGTDISEADRTRERHDTSPIPVIRDAGQPAAQPRASEPVPVPEPFSVWEPAPKPGPAPEPEPGPKSQPFSVWEPAPERGQQQDRDSRSEDPYQPAHADPPAARTQAKIEQIKDLYLTAEAIGEDALSRHFDELRQRQRSLISEFFDNAGLGAKDKPTLLGDDPAQDGASLPG